MFTLDEYGEVWGDTQDPIFLLVGGVSVLNPIFLGFCGVEAREEGREVDSCRSKLDLRSVARWYRAATPCTPILSNMHVPYCKRDFYQYP